MFYNPVATFKSMRLHKKLILSYLFVVLLPVILVGYFLVTRTTATVLKQTNNIALVNFQQMKNNISNQLNSYLNLTDSVYTETDIMEYLGKENTDESKYFDRYQDYRKIYDIFRLRITDRGEVSTIIYTANPTIITDNFSIIPIDSKITNQQWFKAVTAAKGAIVIWGPHMDSQNRLTISFGRVLNINAANKYINVLVTEFSESDIYSLMEKEGLNKKVYLLDGSNTIISSTDRDYLGKNISTAPGMEGITFNRADVNTVKPDNKNDIIFYGFFNDKNAVSDWKLVSVVSSETMLKDISGIVKYAILICTVIVVIAIIFVLLFANKLTKRLKMLVRNMAKIRDGKFDVFVEHEEKDEIGELSKSFKNMVDRINNLINEVYLLDIKKKEAEINALQSQINPHFLFNTMESIRMDLWDKQCYETSEVIQKFSELLRISINWGNDIISIKQEIDLIETYLKIQKYRYDDKFEYEINIAEDLYSHSIPKFTLQPLVENAIYHGIEMKKGKGMLRIYSQTSENQLKIIILDDGVGMNEETLTSIREHIYSEHAETGRTRVGIRNVHQRLILLYGVGYGVFIESVEDQWTKVEVLLPSNGKDTVKDHV